MLWALQWVAGWLLALWVLRLAVEGPMNCGNPPAPMATPYEVGSLLLSRRPQIVESPAPREPEQAPGIDLAHWSRLLDPQPVPPPTPEPPRGHNPVLGFAKLMDAPEYVPPKPDLSRLERVFHRTEPFVKERHPFTGCFSAREVAPNFYQVIPRPSEGLHGCGRVVPAFHNGRAIGFKLLSMPPDSGFKGGDTLLAINGFRFTSPEHALEAYSQLKDASRFEVDLERDGRLLKLTFAFGFRLLLPQRDLGLDPGDVLLSVNGHAITSAESAREAYEKEKAASRIEVEFERDGRLLKHSYPVTRRRAE